MVSGPRKIPRTSSSFPNDCFYSHYASLHDARVLCYSVRRLTYQKLLYQLQCFRQESDSHSNFYIRENIAGILDLY
jgi:hypothetical protein